MLKGLEALTRAEMLAKLNRLEKEWQGYHSGFSDALRHARNTIVEEPLDKVIERFQYWETQYDDWIISVHNSFGLENLAVVEGQRAIGRTLLAH